GERREPRSGLGGGAERRGFELAGGRGRFCVRRLGRRAAVCVSPVDGWLRVDEEPVGRELRLACGGAERRLRADRRARRRLRGGGTCAATASVAASAAAPATVVAGLAYVGASDGKLYAFSTACLVRGGLSCVRWSSAATAGSIKAAPAVAAGRVFVGSQDGSVY